MPQNHYGIGNGNYALFRHIQTIAFFLSFPLLLERVGYAYLRSEKKVVFDRKKQNLHAFVSSFPFLTPCKTIASSSSPKSKPDSSFLTNKQKHYTKLNTIQTKMNKTVLLPYL